MPENKGNQLLRSAAVGSLYGFAGAAATKVLGMVLQVVVSRMYGPAYFGLFVTGLMLCQILHVVATLGLQKGGMRFMSMAHVKENQDDLASIVRLSALLPIGTGLLIGLGMYLLAPFLAVRCFQDPQLTGVISYFSVAVPSLALLRTLGDLSRAFKTTKYAVLVEDFLFVFLQLAFFAAFHFAGFGFYSVVYSFIASSAIAAAVMLIVVHGQIKRVQKLSTSSHQQLREERTEWKEILKYSLPLMPVGLMHMGASFVDIIMLNILSTSAQVGEYAAAARWMLVFNMIIRPLNLIFAPLIAGQMAANSDEQIKVLYKTGARWGFFISLLICVFVLLARFPLMHIFGTDFLEIGPTVLAILLLGVIPLSITSSAANLLIMGEYQYKELWLMGVRIVLNVVLNAFMISRYGAVGAAIATTVSNAVVDFWRIKVVHRIFAMQPFDKLYVFPLLTSVAVCALVMVMHGVIGGSLLTQLGVAAAAALLVCCVIIFTGLSPHDKVLLHELKLRLKNGRLRPPGPRGMAMQADHEIHKKAGKK